MNPIELDRALRTLRLSGMARALEARLVQAQADSLAHLDFLSLLVTDELGTRADRLIARRIKAAQFRDANRTLDNFDFGFNKKMDRRLVFELATCRFINNHEDALFLGPPGTGKSHLAQALGMAAVLNGHRVLYREAHALLEELADANLDGQRKDFFSKMQKAALLIVDDIGMRKLPASAAEDMLELIMRRHERASTILTSNRPVEDWGKMLGDTAAVTAMLDRVLHHGHVFKCGPRSYRSQRRTALKEASAAV